jgi:hypothetical protein
VGSVIGGVSQNCGDRDFPGIYSRIDHPQILDFIWSNAFQKTVGTQLMFLSFAFQKTVGRQLMFLIIAFIKTDGRKLPNTQ